ncbi:MAG: ABC transporter ATP-binding protein [Actinomycetes bacterium]
MIIGEQERIEIAERIASCPRSGRGEAPEVVNLDGLRKSFGDVQAVDGADFSLRAGQIGALLGPSGCGKTTLLRLLAGFERPDAGTVTVLGEEVASPTTFIEPEKRRIGMVFQDFALFPHLDVAANVGYPMGRKPDGDRIARLLRLVGLEGLGDRRPDELSGGQQQRVAIARALALAPALVLLDEPFSNLDAALRDRMRREIRDILRAAGVTALLVTHDQEEALSLADTVAVMNEGRIEQVGTPEQVYSEPINPWVARFLGEVNVFEGLVADRGVVEMALGRVRVASAGEVTGRVDVMVRPESVSIVEDSGVAAVVVERSYYGHDQLLLLELEDGGRVTSRNLGLSSWYPGDRVRVALTGHATVRPRSD